MAQTTNFNSNNTENGWIYNFLNQKIDKIESDMAEIMNLVEKAYGDMNISLAEYQNLINNMSSKCSMELYNAHVNNNALHMSPSEKALLTSKFEIDDIKSITVDKENNLLSIKTIFNGKEIIHTIPIEFK